MNLGSFWGDFYENKHLIDKSDIITKLTPFINILILKPGDEKIKK
jgi:hypothetical protein